MTPKGNHRNLYNTPQKKKNKNKKKKNKKKKHLFRVKNKNDSIPIVEFDEPSYQFQSTRVFTLIFTSRKIRTKSHYHIKQTHDQCLQ